MIKEDLEVEELFAELDMLIELYERTKSEAIVLRIREVRLEILEQLNYRR